MSEYLRPKALAERWDVSEDTIRNWIDSGKLKGKKMGGVYRVHRNHVEEFEAVEKKGRRGGRPKAEHITQAEEAAAGEAMEREDPAVHYPILADLEAEAMRRRLEVIHA